MMPSAIAAMPILPDLVGFLLRGRVEMMDEPDSFLPTAKEIEEMSETEGTFRLHFFVSALLLCYFITQMLGTSIMVLGSKCLNCRRPFHHDEEAVNLVPSVPSMAKLRVGKQRLLVATVFLATYGVSLMATIYSISKQSLSPISGLDWELWLALFALNALSMLVQAFVAVGRLNVGRSFRLGAFAEASLMGMSPVISDQFDTVKDVVFAGLCFQSDSLFLRVMGICSLLYLLFIHFYFLSMDSTLAELAASHIPVVLVPSTALLPTAVPAATTAAPGGTGCGVVKRRILPVLYRQTTPTRRWMLCMENFPQAVLALAFLCLEGGSLVVATLNLLFPAAQLTLAWIFFPRLRQAVAPWLGERLGIALDDEDQLGARRLWNEADLDSDLGLLRVALPHIRPMMDAFQLQESPEALGDEKLIIIRAWWQVLVEPSREEASFSGYDLSEANAKVMASALRWNTTLKKLCLQDNRFNAAGYEALAAAARNSALEELHLTQLSSEEKTEALAQFMAGKCRSELLNLRHAGVTAEVAQVLSAGIRIPGHSASVKKLDLSENDFGIAGLEAIMEALKVNMTLRELCLENTMINHFGVEELAVTLRQNTVLRKLSLIGNNIGLDGTQALVNAARAGAIEELHLFELRPFEYHQTDPNQALAEILVGSFSQSELDLHFCCITDEVTQALAMALQYNQTLVHLRLDLNKIRVAGAKALATALSENRCVQILNLAGNALGDAGAQAIAEALERNRTLVELVLNKNNIGQQGTEALCSAMMTNSSLKKLALVGNDWGDIGLQVLVRSAYRSSLEELYLFELPRKEHHQVLARFLGGNFEKNELDLERSGMTDSMAEAVGIALKMNSTVKKLCLRYNDLSEKGFEAINRGLELPKRRTSLLSLRSFGSKMVSPRDSGIVIQT